MWNITYTGSISANISVGTSVASLSLKGGRSEETERGREPGTERERERGERESDKVSVKMSLATNTVCSCKSHAMRDIDGLVIRKV